MIHADRCCSRLALRLMVILGVGIAGGSAARADIIFSKSPLNNAASGISDLGFGQQEADDFVLAGPIGTVVHLRWWGSYGGSPDPASTDDFRVRFFNDAGGSPSTTFFAELNLTGVTRAATSLTSSSLGAHDGGTVYQYEADLVPALSLTPGTTYYLSILNNTGSSWGWLESDPVGGGGSHWFRSGVPWILSSRATDFAFELEGPPAPVPEPISLFSNPPLNNAASGISDLGFGQQEADDFVLAGPIGTVVHLRWWGSYGGSPDPAPTDDFRVRFFNDAGGSPSTTFFAELNLTGVTRTITSLTSSTFGAHDGGTVYQYEADLVPPLSLTPGTTYYLSILNNTGSSWGWLESDPVGGGGSHWFRSGVPWSLSSRATDFAFELEGAGAPVPEPASLAMMGLLGLLGSLGARHIRPAAATRRHIAL